MTIDAELATLVERENALKQEMETLKEMKKRLNKQKRKQDAIDYKDRFLPYVDKFAQFNMRLVFESRPLAISIVSDDTGHPYQGAWYTGEHLTEENLDELLVKLEQAKYIEQHTDFKLTSTNNGIKMALFVPQDTYNLYLDETYNGKITKERVDVDDTYVHHITPKLSVHIEAIDYDGLFATWVYEISGTRDTIIDEINQAVQILKEQ